MVVNTVFPQNFQELGDVSSDGRTKKMIGHNKTRFLTVRWYMSSFHFICKRPCGTIIRVSLVSSSCPPQPAEVCPGAAASARCMLGILALSQTHTLQLRGVKGENYRWRDCVLRWARRRRPTPLPVRDDCGCSSHGASKQSWRDDSGSFSAERLSLLEWNYWHPRKNLTLAQLWPHNKSVHSKMSSKEKRSVSNN